MFYTKNDASGEMIRHKARLVAKGFLDVVGPP